MPPRPPTAKPSKQPRSTGPRHPSYYAAPGDATLAPIGESAVVDEHEPAAILHTALVPLYTPAAAAELLSVRESWLRRKAGARAIACTFLGKHLRFSPADIEAIIEAGAHRPPPSARRRPQRTRRTP